MSAKALTAFSLAPAVKPTIATEHPAPEGLDAEVQFREDLWCEYLIEANKAGLTQAQAINYANALSSEMGLTAGPSRLVPTERFWFYQSRPRVVRRTVTSGLIELTHGRKRKAAGRPAAAGASGLPYGFRWWNAEGKS